jgi:hypothetical protein
VIVDDLDIKGVTVTPPETGPPLLGNPNAVLALPIAFSSRIQLLQLHQRPLLDVARETLGVLATPDLLGLSTSKGFDHVRILTRRVSNV